MFYIVDIKSPPPLHFSSLNSILKFCCESTTIKKKKLKLLSGSIMSLFPLVLIMPCKLVSTSQNQIMAVP